MIILLSCVPIEEFEKQVELFDNFLNRNLKYHEILIVRNSFKSIYCKNQKKTMRRLKIYFLSFFC